MCAPTAHKGRVHASKAATTYPREPQDTPNYAPPPLTARSTCSQTSLFLPYSVRIMPNANSRGIVQGTMAPQELLGAQFKALCAPHGPGSRECPDTPNDKKLSREKKRSHSPLPCPDEPVIPAKPQREHSSPNTEGLAATAKRKEHRAQTKQTVIETPSTNMRMSLPNRNNPHVQYL